MATIYDGGSLGMRRTGAGRGHFWLQLILGVWLFLSPWVLGFANGDLPAAGPPAMAIGDAMWDAWILGGLVTLVALSAATRLALWQDQAILVLGAWIIAAPWVLGFGRGWPPAAWDHWLTGLLLFLVSAWAIPERGERR